MIDTWFHYLKGAFGIFLECNFRKWDFKKYNFRKLKFMKNDFVIFGISEKKCWLKSWESNFDVFDMHVIFLRICH